MNKRQYTSKSLSFGIRSFKSSCILKVRTDIYSSWNELTFRLTHKETLIKTLNQYKHDIKSLKYLKRLNQQRKIQKLEYKIKNHKLLFPEEYI